MGVPVPRALAYFRFVFVGLAVADAPRHRANGCTGIGVDHALFDGLRRYGTGRIAHDPAVVVADDFSIFACHRSPRALGAEHCRLSGFYKSSGILIRENLQQFPKLYRNYKGSFREQVKRCRCIWIGLAVRCGALGPFGGRPLRGSAADWDCRWYPGLISVEIYRRKNEKI